MTDPQTTPSVPQNADDADKLVLNSPEEARSAKDFVLWAGVILLAAPFALGVPILFALALWILARGASGVWALKSGREIIDPLGWWI